MTRKPTVKVAPLAVSYHDRICTAGSPHLCYNQGAPLAEHSEFRHVARWTITWPRKTVLACDAHMAGALRSAHDRYGMAVAVPAS